MPLILNGLPQLTAIATQNLYLNVRTQLHCICQQLATFLVSHWRDRWGGPHFRTQLHNCLHTQLHNCTMIELTSESDIHKESAVLIETAVHNENLILHLRCTAGLEHSTARALGIAAVRHLSHCCKMPLGALETV